MRTQRCHHQYHRCAQDATHYNSIFKRSRSSVLIHHSNCPAAIKKHSQNIEKLVLRKEQYRFTRRSITTTTTPWLSFSSSSISLNDDNHDNINEISEDYLTLSSSSSLKSSSDNESFEVTKIVTETAEIETMSLFQSEIMMQTILSPRDPVSLRLTSKKERREDWVGNTLVEQMRQRHPPTIMARNDFILLALGPVRAVAERDTVYVFDARSKTARSFTKDLSRMYQQRSARIKRLSSDMDKNYYIITERI